MTMDSIRARHSVSTGSIRQLDVVIRGRANATEAGGHRVVLCCVSSDCPAAISISPYDYCHSG